MLNPADHTYQGIITGKKRASVTTILAEEGYIQKRFYREGFADLGTQVHKMLHAYDMGWKFSAPSIYLRYLEPWKKFLSHTGIKIIDSEVEIEYLLYSGFSGTLDKICLDPRCGYGIIDVKVSECGWIFWHEAQTEAYRQGLKWLPKYKNLDIKWRGGVILGSECKMPKLIPHNRVPDISKIWSAIVVSNNTKHLYKIGTPEISESEGWK